MSNLEGPGGKCWSTISSAWLTTRSPVVVVTLIAVLRGKWCGGCFTACLRLVGWWRRRAACRPRYQSCDCARGCVPVRGAGMSASHMGMVFDAEGLDRSEKLLLLGYTNRTDAHGLCWPSEERLARDCGMSRSTVQRTKRKLVERGLLRSLGPGYRHGRMIKNITWVNLLLLESMAGARVEVAQGDGIGLQQGAYGGSGVVGWGASDESDPSAGEARRQSAPPRESDWLGSRSRMKPIVGQIDSQSLMYPAETPKRNTTSVLPSLRGEGSRATDPGTEECGRGMGHLSEAVVANGSAAGVMPQREPVAEERDVRDQPVIGRPSAAAETVPPGVELLLAIGAEKAELLLFGKPLMDQGRVVTGMLERGWTPAQLRHVIASRPLPDPLKKTVGAVIGGRLKQACAAPPPSSMAHILDQAPTEGDARYAAGRWQHRPTAATPADRSVAEAITHRVAHECGGQFGECGRPVSGPGVLCHHCVPQSGVASVNGAHVSRPERVADASGMAEVDGEEPSV
ncbi:helix-turn-helix domain-containing protein [Streptomyces sp. NPDC002133]|uniref:helix-turn-helix domain-containing protein n=1 Tax=Streptomyces sp. NPDC002133 TaxID=3154409 RepID=UPI0033313E88